MLREIPNVRQIPGEPARRWFADERMDLYVWLGDAGAIIGFQLAYDKPHAEKAITWKRESGYLHTGVDDGARPSRHPGTPILVADGRFDANRVLREFRDRAVEIDTSVEEFVSRKISQFSGEEIPALDNRETETVPESKSRTP